MKTVSDFLAHVEASLGASPSAINPDRFVRFGRRKSCWAYLFSDMRGGAFGDWRTGVNGTWSAIDRWAMSALERANFEQQAQRAARERHAQQLRQWQINADQIARLQAQLVPVVSGDPVALYLANRGMPDSWRIRPALWVHPGLDYWQDGRCIGRWPAMVAAIQSLAGKVLALHRTYLTDTGHKAPVECPKKLTGACDHLLGAAIQLEPPRDGVLGVAEGIETAIAAASGSGIPTWSTYCANALASFQWPAQIQTLVIYADADDAGRVAAERLRRRASQAGVQALVMEPSVEGTDWADVIYEKRWAS